MENPTNPTNPTNEKDVQTLTFDADKYAELISNARQSALEEYKKSASFQKDAFGTVSGKMESFLRKENPTLFSEVKELQKQNKDLSVFEAIAKVVNSKSSNEDLENIKGQYNGLLSEKDKLLLERENEILSLKTNFAQNKLNETFERFVQQKGIGDDKFRKAGLRAEFENSITKEFDAAKGEFVFKDKEGKVLLSKEIDDKGNIKPKTYETLLNEFADKSQIEFSSINQKKSFNPKNANPDNPDLEFLRSKRDWLISNGGSIAEITEMNKIISRKNSVFSKQ